MFRRFRRKTKTTATTRQGDQKIIPTTEGMLRSWSKRSLELFQDKLNDSNNKLGDGEENQPEVIWLDTYMKEYANLFQKEIACDLSFHVLTTTSNAAVEAEAIDPKLYDVLRTHHCILAIQCPKLLSYLTNNKKDNDTQPLVGVAHGQEDTKTLHHQEKTSGRRRRQGGEDDDKSNAYEEFVITDNFFTKNPQHLHTTIERCYGIRKENITRSTLVDDGGDHNNINPSNNASAGFDHYLMDTMESHSDVEICEQLQQLNPNFWRSRSSSSSSSSREEEETVTQCETSTNELRVMAPPDVQIVGSVDDNDDNTEWTVFGHTAILSAHSDYFCSILTNPGWLQGDAHRDNKDANDDDDDDVTYHDVFLKRCRLLRFDDSRAFSKDTMELLVSVCYGSFLNLDDMSFDKIQQLLNAATYLGMKVASLQCEQALASSIDTSNLANMIQVAEDHGAQFLLSESHKFLCTNLNAIRRQGGTLQLLHKSHLEAMLRSDFIEAPEDDILNAVLAWSDQTVTSYDETKDLIGLIRLPLVPVDSPLWTHIVSRNLVGQEMLRVCRLFQTDSDYRETMINSEPMYRPRYSKFITSMLRQTVTMRIFEQHGIGREICRMLGTVNGRCDFNKIDSVQLAKSGDHLVCNLPNLPIHLTLDDRIFQFDGVETDHMPPTSVNQAHQLVDQAVLEKLPLEDVRQLLAAMLQRENALRLHPRIQSAMGSIGENEEELSRFTSELQAYVASEFQVDLNVGTELIRSASSLFPDIAQLVHYVRFNRCFEGSLSVGDRAPNVNLSTLTGETTTLFTEVDKQQQQQQLSPSSVIAGEKNNTINMPVVILGASYT